MFRPRCDSSTLSWSDPTMDSTVTWARNVEVAPKRNPPQKPQKSILTVSSQDESLHGKKKTGVEHKNGRQSVWFDTIEIREYMRAVGDNPSCSSGPPLTISWEYDPDVINVPVEEFEEYRPERRTQFELLLGRDERHEILQDEWGIPQSEIADAIRKNIKAKNQRLQTLNNIGRVSDMEEKVETVRRKLKKRISWQKKSSKKGQRGSVNDSKVRAPVVQKQKLRPFAPRLKQESKVGDDSSAT